MVQYIDKSALVAEIKNLENTYKKCPTRNSYEDGLKDGRLIGYKDALYKIDTLEVKEVDREKEFEKCCENYIFDDECEVYTARHFFELGLKAKGE